ncbi:hypothetical protein [Desulforegula conservatrix]|uniref:hypothetical protein n=1 Tax=Desulforegula conservatrix TaxID=153026 RepID=UPI000412E150|nr:hypothetical protein [Desulforegula conservatrix]
MAAKEKETITAELDDRLDALFAEDGLEDEIMPSKPQKASAIINEEHFEEGELKPSVAEKLTGSSPLNNLSAIILSMDWEITEDTMNNFLSEVVSLKDKYSDDKILFTFLKLHESVGTYINNKKAEAHPESIQFLHSAYTAFEKAVNSLNMEEKDKKKLLKEQINKFGLLKAKISGQQPADTIMKKSADGKTVLSNEVINLIKAEVKRIITEEMGLTR